MSKYVSDIKDESYIHSRPKRFISHYNKLNSDKVIWTQYELINNMSL